MMVEGWMTVFGAEVFWGRELGRSALDIVGGWFLN